MTDINQKGAAKHFAQIFRTWDGISMIRRRYSIITDPRGRITAKTPTDTSLTGVISSIASNPKLRGAGWIDEENSVGFFNDTDFKKGDHIIWSGQGEFEVVKVMSRIFDVDVGVAATVELVKVPE